MPPARFAATLALRMASSSGSCRGRRGPWSWRPAGGPRGRRRPHRCRTPGRRDSNSSRSSSRGRDDLNGVVQLLAQQLHQRLGPRTGSPWPSRRGGTASAPTAGVHAQSCRWRSRSVEPRARRTTSPLPLGTRMPPIVGASMLSNSWRRPFDLRPRRRTTGTTERTLRRGAATARAPGRDRRRRDQKPPPPPPGRRHDRHRCRRRHRHARTTAPAPEAPRPEHQGGRTARATGTRVRTGRTADRPVSSPVGARRRGRRRTSAAGGCLGRWSGRGARRCGRWTGCCRAAPDGAPTAGPAVGQAAEGRRSVGLGPESGRAGAASASAAAQGPRGRRCRGRDRAGTAGRRGGRRGDASAGAAGCLAGRGGPRPSAGSSSIRRGNASPRGGDRLGWRELAERDELTHLLELREQTALGAGGASEFSGPGLYIRTVLPWPESWLPGRRRVIGAADGGAGSSWGAASSARRLLRGLWSVVRWSSGERGDVFPTGVRGSSPAEGPGQRCSPSYREVATPGRGVQVCTSAGRGNVGSVRRPVTSASEPATTHNFRWRPAPTSRTSGRGRESGRPEGHAERCVCAPPEKHYRSIADSNRRPRPYDQGMKPRPSTGRPSGRLRASPSTENVWVAHISPPGPRARQRRRAMRVAGSMLTLDVRRCR